MPYAYTPFDGVLLLGYPLARSSSCSKAHVGLPGAAQGLSV